MANDLSPAPFLPMGMFFPIPTPVAGCRECAGYYAQWISASAPNNPRYNPSRAVDLAVLIKRHPHGS